MSIILTDEQEKFIEKALNGKNILVDACVGSGKNNGYTGSMYSFS